MRRRVEGVVESIVRERPGAQELTVRVEQETARNGSASSATRSALNFTMLTGPVAAGERVLLNTVAVEMGLGTGGMDFVVASPDRPVMDEAAPGHILKLRYTPLQTPILAVESPESPHHDALRLFASLDDLPVVCAELHSQIAAICASAHWALRESGWARPPRLVYIMTDGAALPLALSRLIPQLKAHGLLEAVITCGQAFGGDYEAINMYSALAAAKEVVEADIVVMAQGPGNAGTDTSLGFSGVDQGLAINAAASLGGVPITVPRISFADRRDRHYGLSHHTATILRHIARAQTLLPLPRLPQSQMRILRNALEEIDIEEEHEPIIIDAEPGLRALESTGIAVTTMGRSIEEERPFFLAAAAAGLLAAQLAEARRA